MVAYLEQEMNSVERLDELIKTESEKPAHIEGKEVPAFWPSDGAIEVKNLTLRYAPDLPVVLNASFDVKPRETIGIVGRTGSGKRVIAFEDNVHEADCFTIGQLLPWVCFVSSKQMLDQ